MYPVIWIIIYLKTTILHKIHASTCMSSLVYLYYILFFISNYILNILNNLSNQHAGVCFISISLFLCLLHLSSPKLKAQVSFSDRLLSDVCLSVCLSVCPSVNFSDFQLHLQNQWTNFNQTWHKASFGGGDSSLVERRPLSKGR